MNIIERVERPNSSTMAKQKGENGDPFEVFVLVYVRTLFSRFYPFFPRSVRTFPRPIRALNRVMHDMTAEGEKGEKETLYKK